MPGSREPRSGWRSDRNTRAREPARARHQARRRTYATRATPSSSPTAGRSALPGARTGTHRRARARPFHHLRPPRREPGRRPASSQRRPLVRHRRHRPGRLLPRGARRHPLPVRRPDRRRRRARGRHGAGRTGRHHRRRRRRPDHAHCRRAPGDPRTAAEPERDHRARLRYHERGDRRRADLGCRLRAPGSLGGVAGAAVGVRGGGIRLRRHPGVGDGTARAAQLSDRRARPGRPALRAGDPGAGHTGIPRLRRAAAHPRMGPNDRRGPQLHRHRLVADCAARSRGGGRGAGHEPHQRHAAEGAGRMSTHVEGTTAQVASGADAPDGQPGPVLQVRDLNVAYTSRRVSTPVIHDVSLSISAGDVVALVGESGSGKTTTARAILGLLPENGHVLGGQILLGGTDITGWPDKRMSAIRGPRIGWIPQDPNNSLNPLKRIGDSLAEVLRIHRWADKPAIQTRVIALLDRVGIPEPAARARQYPHELSGGMKQRVLIASAIALKPDLIIADEATSALDVTVQRTILDLLDELRAEIGTAVLLVTHDLAVAADRATDVVALSDGRVAEAGRRDRVRGDPHSDYSRRLLADAPAFATTARHSVSEVRERLEQFRGSAAGETQPSQAAAAIEVRDLVQEFSFGTGRRFRAVDDVSFEVAPGTTHALVGESGSGKTTTARAVMAFTRPTSGRIRVAGEDMFSARPRELRQLRSRVQMVYQNPFSSLDPRQ